MPIAESDISLDKCTSLPAALLEATLVALEQAPDRIKEYELLTILRQQGFFTFLDNGGNAQHALFQAHFLLYHVLYLLRDKLIAAKQAWLEIDVLSIKLHSYQATEAALALSDPLRAYYLDLSNLEDTSEEEVYELIASFWKKFTSYERRDEALTVLGLEDPVSNKDIKDAYRRLVMQYHPDRGGDKQRLQMMNAAINVLLP